MVAPPVPTFWVVGPRPNALLMADRTVAASWPVVEITLAAPTPLTVVIAAPLYRSETIARMLIVAAMACQRLFTNRPPRRSAAPVITPSYDARDRINHRQSSLNAQ
jgi:hypothetical protein